MVRKKESGAKTRRKGKQVELSGFYTNEDFLRRRLELISSPDILIDVFPSTNLTLEDNLEGLTLGEIIYRLTNPFHPENRVPPSSKLIKTYVAGKVEIGRNILRDLVGKLMEADVLPHFEETIEYKTKGAFYDKLFPAFNGGQPIGGYVSRFLRQFRDSDNPRDIKVYKSVEEYLMSVPIAGKRRRRSPSGLRTEFMKSDANKQFAMEGMFFPSSDSESFMFALRRKSYQRFAKKMAYRIATVERLIWDFHFNFDGPDGFEANQRKAKEAKRKLSDLRSDGDGFPEATQEWAAAKEQFMRYKHYLTDDPVRKIKELLNNVVINDIYGFKIIPFNFDSLPGVINGLIGRYRSPISRYDDFDNRINPFKTDDIDEITRIYDITNLHGYGLVSLENHFQQERESRLFQMKFLSLGQSSPIHIEAAIQTMEDLIYDQIDSIAGRIRYETNLDRAIEALPDVSRTRYEQLYRGITAMFEGVKSEHIISKD